MSESAVGDIGPIDNGAGVTPPKIDSDSDAEWVSVSDSENQELPVATLYPRTFSPPRVAMSAPNAPLPDSAPLDLAAILVRDSPEPPHVTSPNPSSPASSPAILPISASESQPITAVTSVDSLSFWQRVFRVYLPRFATHAAAFLLGVYVTRILRRVGHLRSVLALLKSPGTAFNVDDLPISVVHTSAVDTKPMARGDAPISSFAAAASAAISPESLHGVFTTANSRKRSDRFRRRVLQSIAVDDYQFDDEASENKPTQDDAADQQRDQDFAQLPECADEWLLSRESFVHKFASDARFDDVLLNTCHHFPQRKSATEATKSSCIPGSCSAACSPPHGKSADSYVSFAKQISQDVETMRAVMRAKQQRILRSLASTAAAGAAGAGGVNGVGAARMCSWQNRGEQRARVVVRSSLVQWGFGDNL
eukprot:TRINITY_DN6012_c0_g1_i2.p1 TRINITY_DN6012_c0_g1~~TRINITY_DN6012_c0_g1_i2.p1  ORF type:complete len:422 (+),score=76.66 TRINITY_DN6012_c0_g1_i2:106-1371(+)